MEIDKEEQRAVIAAWKAFGLKDVRHMVEVISAHSAVLGSVVVEEDRMYAVWVSAMRFALGMIDKKTKKKIAEAAYHVKVVFISVMDVILFLVSSFTVLRSKGDTPALIAALYTSVWMADRLIVFLIGRKAMYLLVVLSIMVLWKYVNRMKEDVELTMSREEMALVLAERVKKATGSALRKAQAGKVP
jgi:hypothetical protein